MNSPQNKIKDNSITKYNYNFHYPNPDESLPLTVYMDGETIIKVEPQIDSLRQEIKKIVPNLNNQQKKPFSEDYDNSYLLNVNYVYILALEKLLKIEVPEYNKYIRIIIVELNRIASHLYCFETLGLNIGAANLIKNTLRDRKIILNILNTVYEINSFGNYFQIGGIAKDIPVGFLENIYKFIDYFHPRICNYKKTLQKNKILIDRTANIGILFPDTANYYGITGPNLRASGIKQDIRKDKPYSLYNELEFDVPVGKGLMGTTGDSWDRFWVRCQEMNESVKIISQLLDKIPVKAINNKVQKVLQPLDIELNFQTENPTGKLNFDITTDASDKSFQLKMRCPSFSCLIAINKIVSEHLMSDLPIILSSLDIRIKELSTHD